ncbi:MAG: hypothetical protein EBQ95_05485 [Gammaproteobacteria bacterium]|nr:hypothetical protein [Gammaproteobacteria bacterium]
MLKKFTALFLFVLSLSSFADIGYIRHQINNKTPYTIFVNAREAYAYPTEACFGMLASNAQKICDSEYNTDYGVFFLDLIKHEDPAKADLTFNLKIPKIKTPESLTLTWNIGFEKEDYVVRYSLTTY